MNITVFGASGKVGRLAVAEALERGHTVTAFVHRESRELQQLHTSHPQQLRFAKGDIHSREDVRSALKDSQAVLSALGSWHTKTKDILSAGMSSIIPVMQEQGILRIVTLTGTEAYAAGDSKPLPRRLAHTLASIGAGRILRDGEKHIELLRESNLDWTTLRSPVMTGSSETFYRLTLQPEIPLRTIPRKAVAKALVDQIDGPAYSRAAPFIYSQKSRF